MFRLHIDIPLDVGEDEAVKEANRIILEITNSLREKNAITETRFEHTKKLQYRLASDDDRTVRNYLVKDENGHVSTKKSVVEL